jgi:hypothetical protein
MDEQFAQGDLLFEHVSDTPASETLLPAAGDVTVLAEGEATGHRHAIYDQVAMFRDESLARDVPRDLYVGHVRIDAEFARVEHNEHNTITLPRGTYRVSRQREMEPKDAALLSD